MALVEVTELSIWEMTSRSLSGLVGWSDHGDPAVDVPGEGLVVGGGANRGDDGVAAWSICSFARSYLPLMTHHLALIARSLFNSK